MAKIYSNGNEYIRCTTEMERNAYVNKIEVIDFKPEFYFPVTYLVWQLAEDYQAIAVDNRSKRLQDQATKLCETVQKPRGIFDALFFLSNPSLEEYRGDNNPFLIRTEFGKRAKDALYKEYYFERIENLFRR